MSERPCPYCKNERKAVVVVPHPYIDNKFKTAIRWCICMLAQFVSESTENTILSSFEGDIIPLDKINSNLEFIPDELFKSPNLLIRGDYDTFCNHLRSTLIKYRYKDPPSSIYCCEAINVLQRFYVEQNDKSCMTLSETEKYDLMVICLGNKQKNDQLKTCIAEVVYMRKKKKKPTWVYMPHPSLEQCVWEKSPELEEYLKEYKAINIAADGIAVDRTSKTNSKLSNFNIGGR
jgi:hypothetical protein